MYHLKLYMCNQIIVSTVLVLSFFSATIENELGIKEKYFKKTKCLLSWLFLPYRLTLLHIW